MKNKIHYLFLCLCLVCTAPFLASCGDDKDETGTETGSDPASPKATIIGQWVTNSSEEWTQQPGSSERENYQKEYFTTTLIIQEDGTGMEIEEDGDTFYFEWEYNDKTGDLYRWEPKYEEEIEAKLTWKSGSKFVMLEKGFDEYDNSYYYRQSTYTRTK